MQILCIEDGIMIFERTVVSSETCYSLAVITLLQYLGRNVKEAACRKMDASLALPPVEMLLGNRAESFESYDLSQQSQTASNQTTSDTMIPLHT